VIIYLIKEAGMDSSIKNKFGYVASDCALDASVRKLFQQLLGVAERESESGNEVSAATYGR
jgi:hypothetical protein